MNFFDLTNKTAIVTGACGLIGQKHCEALALAGANVVVADLHIEKAREVAAGLPGSIHLPLAVDVTSPESLAAARDEIITHFGHIDVLVNNAGLMFGAQREVSPDGYEMTLATNHLGPFLLTSLLFDLLQKSPAARVVNVASMAYRFSKPTLDDLQSERSYSAVWEYGNTKLWNIMFTQELAQRLRAHGITNVMTNALHPGAVATGYGKQSGGWLSAALAVARPFMISPEHGAETSIFLATDATVGTVSGGFFSKKKAEPVKSTFNTPANNRRLWELSEQLTGTKFLD